MTDDGGHDGRRAAARAVARVVRVEAVVLVLVVGLTGFLVNRSPREAEAAPPPAPSQVQTVLAGEDAKVLATLSPGVRGPNTLQIQVQDLTGEPIELFRAPTARISSMDSDLGGVVLLPTASGTYAGPAVLPRSGTWEVSVSLQFDRFTNPVVELTFEVD